jgi:acyl-CoA dehydrogenase
MSSRTNAFWASYLDSSHEQFREACTRFASEEIAPHAQDWEEAELFDKALYARAAEAGILGPTLPEEYGGGGGDVFHSLVCTEALLRGGCTGAVVGLNSLEIALPPILLHGSEEQKQRFVVPVLAGERIAGLAITEPGAGSDVSAVTTRAIKDGDDYLLTGTKLYVTSGVRADQLTVLARTGPDPHAGLTFFVVEAGSEGYAVSRALKKTGWRASDTAEISLDSVRVPASNRLGEEGSGFLCLMQTFLGERLGLATLGYATAEICLDEALRYAQQRETFGKAIAKHQVIRHKLAHMSTQVLAAKTLTYQCAAMSKAGACGPAEIAMTKNFAAEVAREVSHEAVQIFGGMGYMRETLVERFSRDARLLSIGGGTTEIMNEIIGKALGL